VTTVLLVTGLALNMDDRVQGTGLEVLALLMYGMSAHTVGFATVCCDCAPLVPHSDYSEAHFLYC